RQETWPRYAAVSPRLLDKIELVIAELARWHGGSVEEVKLALDVHSGFRAPDHNRRVRRAATDSQHQYGDAADVAIDANGDGKYTAVDSRMVGLAVEIVELKHPGLVGGLGIYTSGHARTTYVHIDARGKRARWRG
ncbi:MAG: D-Ala-D-Ala carboxypeptidase family metallohydrolase, partial [Gemmatimonadales bacterium]